MRSYVHGRSEAVLLTSDDKNIVLQNRTCICTIARRNGELRIRPVGGEEGAGLRARSGIGAGSRTYYSGDGGAISWTIESLPPPFDGLVTVQFQQKLPGGDSWLHLRVAAGETHFVLQTGVGNMVAPIDRFITLQDSACLETMAAGRMLCIAYCGAHSKSPLSRSAVLPVTAGTEASSWWATALFAEGKASLVLGYLSARRFVGRFDLLRGRLTAFNYGEGVTAGSTEVTWSEPLYLAITREPLVALGHYAGLVAGGSGNRVTHPPVFGWGSWTHYHTAVDERTVLRNASELARWQQGRDERAVVHVDHGWEERLRVHRPRCTWTPRAKFSSSMRGLVDSLGNMQLRLGLWVVPFAVNLDRESERRSCEHLVRNRDGEPWRMGGTGSCCCIDPTDPAGERWLRELFRKLKRWGATYYKLDFLRILLAHEPDDLRDGLDQPRIFHRNVTRTEAYRHGLEIIRDEVGGASYLLACGAPLLPSAGLVDGCRIGPDIEKVWGDDKHGIKNCTRSLAANFFWHGRVWHNDPDFLTVPRTENLLRFRGTAVALSGGTTLISANLGRLSGRRQRLLRALRPKRCEPATPVDLGIRSQPSRWQLPVAAHGEKYFLVGLFNWTDHVRNYTVTPRDFGAALDSDDCVAWEFWRQRRIERFGRGWTIRLGARDAALVGVKPLVGRPQLIATSAHYAMGRDEVASLKWSAATLSLKCIFTRKLGEANRVFFYIPDSFRLKAVSGGRPSQSGRILLVRLDGPGRSRLNLTFATTAEFHESDSKN